MSAHRWIIGKLAGAVTPPAKPSTNLAYLPGYATVTADDPPRVYANTASGTVEAPYLGTRPANNADVAVLFVDGSPLILGEINGVPSTIPTS